MVGPPAGATISKIWRRLDEKHHLVTRSRSKRFSDVSLLHESGDGSDYTSPGAVHDSYFKVPFALWQEGPDEHSRWYQVLDLPELAALLIACSLTPPFILPVERGPKWYGISADTIGRGLKGLIDKGILNVHETYRTAPLSLNGYTVERHFTPVGTFKVERSTPRALRAAAPPKPKKSAASRTGAATKKTARQKKIAAAK